MSYQWQHHRFAKPMSDVLEECPLSDRRKANLLRGAIMTVFEEMVADDVAQGTCLKDACHRLKAIPGLGDGGALHLLAALGLFLNQVDAIDK